MAKSQYPRKKRSKPPRSPLPFLLLLVLAALVVSFIWFIRKDGQISSPSAEKTADMPYLIGNTLPSVEEAPWNLKLVNKQHPLVENDPTTTTSLPNGKEVDSRIYDNLTAMLNACKAEGLSPVVCSAYRSASTQRALFDEKLDELMGDGLSYDEAYKAASSEVALPGTSEHDLGLAVDICALSYQLLDEAQADTAEQRWLMEHCAEYGFILRYPQGKAALTGIIWEPWHYRYVGVEAAREITQSGLCLEEYLAQSYTLNQ